MVRGWHHGRIRATRSQRARELLTEFVPELLRVFGATANPDTALLRFDQFLSRLPAGVQLFSLFHANPGLFCAGRRHHGARRRCSPNSLAQRPALLDAVLTAEFSARAAGARRARRRSRRAARRRARFRGHARPAAALGQRARASRSACSCCGARSTATQRRRARSPTSPRRRSPALLPRVDRRFRAQSTARCRAARSRSSRWASSAAAR